MEENEEILAAVDRLYPGGSTNLADGLRLGYEQARSAYRPGGVNVVVLCSDGVANVGMTGPDSITATIAEEGQQGIHLVTVGYGMGNYNDHLMEQLADQGDGFYRYVDTYEEAEHLYVDELTSLLAPVADDARTQVEFDPELVSSYRLIGYDNRAMLDEQFEDLAADAGELGAGHRASALYEVRLAPGVAPGQQIGVARLRWVSAATRAPGSAEAPVLAADPETTPSDDFALATAAADLAELVKRVTCRRTATSGPPPTTRCGTGSPRSPSAACPARTTCSPSSTGSSGAAVDLASPRPSAGTIPNDGPQR